ncbi:hypothetical protein LAZ67_8000192, partial [Cordylochernes scorpioides]
MNRIEPLTSSNYHIWALKISAILRSKKLFKKVIESPKPNHGMVDSKEEEFFKEWEDKNDEAFGIIIVNLSPEQAGIFIGETNATTVWDELKRIHTGNIEDKIIDIGLELKNIQMRNNEGIEAYITRARNIASRSANLGQPISPREMVYHVVRGLLPKFENIAAVLRPQRSASLEEVFQALQEEEMRLNSMGFPKEGQYEKAFKARNDRGIQRTCKFEGKCHTCGKFGHMSRNCWHRQDKANFNKPKGKYPQNNMQTKSSSSGKNNSREHANVANGSTNTEHAFTSAEMIYSSSHLPEEDAHIWNLDSGCTSHMSPREDWLINKIPIDSEINLAEEERFIKAEAQDDVKLSTYTSEGKQDICITDVLYVPRLKSNLLSVRCLVNNGNKVYFEKGIAKIYNCKGDLIAEANEEDRMFIIKTLPRNLLSNKDNCLKAEDKCSAKTMWHRRLGHLNEEYLDKMMKNNMVKGLNFDCQHLEKCEPCILGKLTQNPFKAIENNHSERPLELIHMDLCGPMPTKSLGGANYLNEGIHHQRTVPYSPQSNGIAERTNRTLLDWARTMLFDAKLPTEFWAEAIATAAYLKNCTPTKNDNMKTPIEKWTGHKPSVAHLKIFGSLAYYYIPKNQRNKFDSRARKGIFTGYSRQRKAYRIYDPQDGKIHEVQTVKFDENSKGSDLLTSNVFDQHVQDHIIYRNEQHESDFFQITHTMGSTPEELNTPDNPEPIPESLGLPRKPGRIAGRTNEDIQAKHLINLQEQEERLRASGVRRSERIKERNAANVTELFSTSMNIPKTYREAMNTPFSDQWKEAMEEEFHSLTSHNVWTLVPKPENENLIKGKWIFNIKMNPDGSIDKRKARFVAMGHNQKPGIDYEESFAPVMKLDSLRTLIAIASQQNMKIEQYDVKTAYINAELKDDVYLEQPEGFVQAGQENKVCKLNRSLYGLPQSGRCWNEKINPIFNDIGLRRLESEPCAYILQEEEKTLIIGIYVDDFLIIGSDSTIINRIVKQLDKQIVIVRKEKPIFFLGIKIEEKENCFELSQEAYVEKILKKFNLEECNPVKTPGDLNQDLDNHPDSSPVDPKLYQEMIGSLMYLSVGTRPDITFYVSQLSQYNKDPKVIHLTALKRIYRYLKGTKSYKLCFDRIRGKIEVFTDASWSSTKDSKSFSGYLTKLGSSLLSWKSQKQPLVALSTCEAELMAICEGTKELKWFMNFLSEIGHQSCVEIPLVLKTDSKSAIDWIKGTSHHCRTKHINRKYFFVKDEVSKGNLRISFVNSEAQEADLLTKRLPGDRIQRLLVNMGLLLGPNFDLLTKEGRETLKCKNEELLEFIVDSGSTSHMINSKKFLLDEVDCNSKISIEKKEETLIAKSVGKIQGKKCDLKEVMFVPNLTNNLLSVSAITRNKGKVVFEDEKVFVVKNGKKVLEGEKQENGLYTINIETENPEIEESHLTATQNEEMLKWHRKMGHISFSSLKQLKSMVNGINIEKLSQDEICETCIKAKQIHRVSSLFNYPNREPINDYTHFCHVYLLQNKYEVKGYLKEFITEAENQMNLKVSKIRCDNGGEYVNEDIKSWCKAKGIIMDLTIPHSPQLNGKAERLNRTLMEKTRALLIDSGVEKYMWGEAVRVSAYLLNRSPTQELEKTPAELWFNKRPNLSNLQLFGCEAYVNTLKHIKKLEDRSKKYTFIGYAPNGYRLWDEQSKRIFTARDVIFLDKGCINKEEKIPIVEPEEESEDQLELNEEPKDIPTKPSTSKYNLRPRSSLQTPSRYEEFYLEQDGTTESALLTYSEAISGPNQEKWKKAIKEEKESLAKNEVWEIVKENEASNKKILTSKWLFKVKEDGRYKARLVVRGFEQEAGIDYDETFSPVISTVSLRIYFALMAKRRFVFKTFDIKTAFLYGFLDEEIYVQLPEGYKGNIWPNVKRIFFNLPDEKENYEQTKMALDKYFTPHKNVVTERFKFRQRVQKDDESIDNYLISLRNAKHLKHVPTQETNQDISDLIPEESQENLSSDSTRIEHLNSSDVQIPDDNSSNQDKDTSLNRPSSSRTGSTFNPVVSDRLDAEALHQLPPEVSPPLPTTKEPVITRSRTGRDQHEQLPELPSGREQLSLDDHRTDFTHRAHYQHSVHHHERGGFGRGGPDPRYTQPAAGAGPESRPGDQDQGGSSGHTEQEHLPYCREHLQVQRQLHVLGLRHLPELHRNHLSDLS